MMKAMRRSWTAQYVALIRAVLTERGLLDDPHAAGMLDPWMRVTAGLLRVPVLRRFTTSPLVDALRARILYFDDQVDTALEQGVDQVVIVGAGYDSRAWRFARPSARFFEVDHPGTQEDKRRRAPVGGPTYVPADLADRSWTLALETAGLDPARPSLYVIEGVTMYLAEPRVVDLLTQLADFSSPGSRLAVNFAPPPGWGSRRDRLRQRSLRTLGQGSGERHQFFLRVDDAGPFVEATGWQVEVARSLADVAAEVPVVEAQKVGRASRDA